MTWCEIVERRQHGKIRLFRFVRASSGEPITPNRLRDLDGIEYRVIAKPEHSPFVELRPVGGVWGTFGDLLQVLPDEGHADVVAAVLLEAWEARDRPANDKVTFLHACSCGARPGELHEGGCDREQCCLCGGQAITCGCVYEVSGMDRASLAETHPEIYASGPTSAMLVALAAEEARWGGRLPHAVRASNVTVCHELDLWCRWDGRSFVPCSKDTPGAQEDLNRLLMEGRWDRARRRFVVDGH